MSCQECFSGHEHDGTPKGRMVKLHGLDTYVTEPEGRQAKGIIVVIPDAFGIEFVNNKLLADNYAAKGDYKVYLPDFMLGHSCPSWVIDSMKVVMGPGNYLYKPYHALRLAYGLGPWFYFTRPGRSFPVVKEWFAALRAELEQQGAAGGALPVGAAGFCWGGKHTLLLSHRENFVDSRPLIDAGFTGHPSLMVLPRDIEKIAVPVSFAIPEKDHHIKVPKHTDLIRKILEGKPEGHEGEIRIYSNCGHGFCVRADPLSGDISRQAGEAEDQAISWFNSKLGIRR